MQEGKGLNPVTQHRNEALVIIQQLNKAIIYDLKGMPEGIFLAIQKGGCYKVHLD